MSRKNLFIAFIEQYSPRNYSLVLVVPVVFLILGFLIWNAYLYTFGFVEGDVLKAKFILAGFTFSLATLYLVVFLTQVFYALKKGWKILLRFTKFICSPVLQIPILRAVINQEHLRYVYQLFLISFFTLLTLFWLWFYSFYLFPIIPTFLGGGQPRSISLLVNKENMSLLTSLQVKTGDGADFQTENLCVVHENDNIILILRDDRVLAIDKSRLFGIGSLPGAKAMFEQHCTNLAYEWSQAGGYFTYVLLRTNLSNLIRGITGQPLIEFTIQIR